MSSSASAPQQQPRHVAPNTTSAAASNNSSPVDKLISSGLLQQVLQRLPVSERLQCAALVSRAWAQAADLATTEIVHKLTASKVAGLVGWLQKHGGSVQTLVLSWAEGTPQSERIPVPLPWAQLSGLQRLDLSHCTLPPVATNAASSSSRSPLLPHLKDVRLFCVTLDSIECLLKLATSPALTSFSEVNSTFADAVGGWSQELITTSTRRMLQQLPQLEALWATSLACDTLEHVAAMKCLQKLRLDVWPAEDADADASSLAHRLPSSLTWISLGNACQHGAPVPCPQLQHLSSLQSLSLGLGCSLAAEVLGSSTQLQELELWGIQLLPDSGPQGAAAFLRALQKLTRLQTLRMAEIDLTVPAHSLDLYSGLTASAELEVLEVLSTLAQPLPQGAVQYMFPAGKQQPQLVDLRIHVDKWRGDAQQEEWCVDSQGLLAICRCCPKLAWLTLRGVLHPDADVAALLQLPRSLNTLEVAGSVLDDAAAGIVAQLTQLLRLTLTHAPLLTDLGLEKFTALSQLGSLQTSQCESMSKEMCLNATGNPNLFALDLNPGHGLLLFLPSVSAALSGLCNRSPECLQARLAREQALSVGLMVETQLLQQQLADSQADVQKLQQQQLTETHDA